MLAGAWLPPTSNRCSTAGISGRVSPSSMARGPDTEGWTHDRVPARPVRAEIVPGVLPAARCVRHLTKTYGNSARRLVTALTT